MSGTATFKVIDLVENPVHWHAGRQAGDDLVFAAREWRRANHHQRSRGAGGGIGIIDFSRKYAIAGKGLPITGYDRKVAPIRIFASRAELLGSWVILGGRKGKGEQKWSVTLYLYHGQFGLTYTTAQESAEECGVLFGVLVPSSLSP